MPGIDSNRSIYPKTEQAIAAANWGEGKAGMRSADSWECR